jgi:hypothetical protein
MHTPAFLGSSNLILDRRKFLGVAAGLIAAGVLPKHALALAARIPSNRAALM